MHRKLVHYSSHPSMARLTTRHIYSDLHLFHQLVDEFGASFKKVLGPQGLQPITIIDTRVSLSSRESTRGLD